MGKLKKFKQVVSERFSYASTRQGQHEDAVHALLNEIRGLRAQFVKLEKLVREEQHSRQADKREHREHQDASLSDLRNDLKQHVHPKAWARIAALEAELVVAESGGRYPMPSSSNPPLECDKKPYSREVEAAAAYERGQAAARPQESFGRFYPGVPEEPSCGYLLGFNEALIEQEERRVAEVVSS